MLRIKSLEKKILLHLLDNGRQPILEIARNVGVTRQTVAKKLREMKNKGLVSSFIPKLEPEKFGIGIQAYIFMREDPQSEFRKENERIVKNYAQISEFHRIFGKYDSIAKVLVKDKKELTDLVKELHDMKGVKETETFIVHSTLKDSPEDPFRKVLKDSEELSLQPIS